MSENGKLLDSELALIPGTTKRVRADLAPQVAAFRAAFARRFGKPLSITDAYRPYWLQEQIFRERYTTSFLWGRPTKWWNWRLWYQRPYTAMASVPGKSNHGWGTALDLGSGVNSRYTAEHAWAVANAPTYGFIWPEYWARAAGEWWHFEGVTVISRPILPPPPFVVIGTPPPPVLILEEPLMALTDSEQRELLDLARYLKKGGEGDLFIHQLPGRAADAVSASTLARHVELLAAVAAIPAAVVTALLGTVLDTATDKVGRVRDALRDTRVIARRTEKAVEALDVPRIPPA